MKLIRYISFPILIAALMFAPLAQWTQPVRAAGTGCTTSAPTPTTTVTICLTNPLDGATLVGNVPVTATIARSTGAPMVQRVVFYLNGTYLLMDYQTGYNFTLPTQKWVDGAYTLEVEAVMTTGFVTPRASVGVNFNNGILTPPVNPNHFTPSTGTTPPAGTPFRLVATGDGASGELNAGKVANLVAALNPNMFVYLGDVYEKGSPAEFFNWYGTPSTNFGRFRAITNPTVGNHEYQGGVARGYFDYWDNIPNYYSYNAGGWHFISLNSNSAFVPGTPTSNQYKWLQADLAANAGKCTIAYYHHPLFNIGQEAPKVAMMDMWKLLADYGVDIVLNGHDHDYQRWVPLDGAGVPNPNGMTEFVVGAGGHGMQTFTKTDPRVAFSVDTNPAGFGALLLLLNSDGAHYSYRGTTGAVLDEGVIPCVPDAFDNKAPTTPVGLTATAASATRVNLAWGASSDNVGVVGYSIYRNGTLYKTLPASSQAYSDLNILPLTTYRYVMDAYDKAGNHSVLSNRVSLTTPAMPASLTFLPTADTYVNAASPASNYGKATSLRVDATPDVHSYLRFNVSGLAGTSITRARLLVYANSNAAQGLRALAVADNTWGELTTNYTNMPALGLQLAASPAATAGTWVTLDVTGYVTGEGSFNFGITTPSAVAVSLASRESGVNVAQLILDLQ